MMDNALILGVGGRLVYYGSVTDAYTRFNTERNPDSLFDALTPKDMAEADWDAAGAEWDAYWEQAWEDAGAGEGPQSEER